MQTSLIITGFLLCLAFTGQSQGIDTAAASSTVQKYIGQRGFSGTILIAQDGEPVYHQSYGAAHPLTPDTIQNSHRYSVASVTKLFTSIRILQLAQEGRLALDKPVVSYLPQFEPLVAGEVTPHHLLLHISGLPQEEDEIYQRPASPAAIVQETLQKGKPGEIGQFNYNNIDYMLLGLIIEELTGRSWKQEISDHILDSLGLKNTGFLAYGHYPEHFAYTYSREGKQHPEPDSRLHIENFYAAGSMYATSLDLLQLDQALYSGQLLNAASQQLLSKSYPQYNYVGYGVWNYNYPFVKAQPTVMERRGGILGANVVLIRLTDDNYTIIILSNDDRFNPDSFGDENNLREMLIRRLYQRE